MTHSVDSHPIIAATSYLPVDDLQGALIFLEELPNGRIPLLVELRYGLHMRVTASCRGIPLVKWLKYPVQMLPSVPLLYVLWMRFFSGFTMSTSEDFFTGTLSSSVILGGDLWTD